MAEPSGNSSWTLEGAAQDHVESYQCLLRSRMLLGGTLSRLLQQSDVRPSPTGCNTIEACVRKKASRSRSIRSCDTGCCQNSLFKKPVGWKTSEEIFRRISEQALSLSGRRQGVFLAKTQVQDVLLEGKVMFLEGAMVGLGLGTRLIKVNMTKVRKHETLPPQKPGVELSLPDEALHCARARTQPILTKRRQQQWSGKRRPK